MDRCRFPVLRPSPGLRRRRPHLPIEVISIILSILPADSVVRFRYVSKIWHELISHPVFIKTHLARAPLQIMFPKISNSADGSRWDSNDGGCSSTAHFDLITAADETKRETFAITYSRGGTPGINSGFISCDGLIYIDPPAWLDYTDSPVPGMRPVPFRWPDIIRTPNPAAGGSVCNPLLGELVILPDSQKESIGSVCGFYSHNSSNQYRLLRVTPWPPYVEPPPPYFKYEIFTLGPEEEGSSSSSSSSWRSIPCSTSQSPYDKPPVILDNALHWISVSDEDPVVMVFNTDTEDFLSIQLPQGTVHIYVKLSILIEMDGCLCLLQISELFQMEIWLLNPKHYPKEGWQKKYTIPMVRTGVSWSWPLMYRPICILHGEIIFYRFDQGLIYYNPKLDSFRTVPLSPSSNASLYRKSLVSLLALNKKTRNHFITSTISTYGIS